FHVTGVQTCALPIFTMPAVIPLYFLPVFTSEPGGTLATILSIVPLTSPIAMTMRLLVSSVPVGQLILSIALLALTVLAAMWAAEIGRASCRGRVERS